MLAGRHPKNLQPIYLSRYVWITYTPRMNDLSPLKMTSGTFVLFAVSRWVTAPSGNVRSEPRHTSRVEFDSVHTEK